MDIRNDAHIDLDLLFIGDFAKYLPHTLLGLRLAGQRGVGAMRHYHVNRFEIATASCRFSKKEVFDGTILNLLNLTTIDIKNISPVPICDNMIKIGFRTPFTGRNFPPDLEELLELIRNRLIHFVNEYGSGEKVSDFSAVGSIKSSSKHYHRLERRSSRSGKTTFPSHTGVVEYEIETIDDTDRWLLAVGEVLGCGPDSSFGCGFITFKF
jgi:hypothetical protein